MTTTGYQLLPLDCLHESKLNPRKIFDAAKLKDLTASVKAHGVLTPLLARPNANGFEIAAGHRRYRAARAAGLESVPVVVRDMTDVEFLEIVTIENLQREDVHPLEEADGYRALMKTAGYDADAIAAKVGKSASYVYQRLKLADLIEPARKAFLEDKVTAGHAILLARLGDDDQKQALDETIRQARGIDGTGHVLSVRGLAKHIQERILRDVSKAPWDPADSTLVAAAGPCFTCPKLASNNPPLFGDLAKGSRCLDGGCYNGKLEAFFERRLAEAKEAAGKGEKVVRASTEYNAYPRTPGVLYQSSYGDGGWKDAGAVTCDTTATAVVVATERDGRGPKLGAIIKVCLAPGKCRPHNPREPRGSGRGDGSSYAASERKKAQAAALRNEARRAVAATIMAKVKAPLPRKALELVALGFTDDVWSETQKTVAKLMGWVDEKTKGTASKIEGSELARKVAALSDQDLATYLIALSIGRDLYVGPYMNSPERQLNGAAKLYGVKAEAVKRAVLKAAAAKKKAKAKKPAKAKGGAAAMKKRARAA